MTGGRIDYDGMELTGKRIRSPARQGDRSCPSECFLSGSAHEGRSICEERQKDSETRRKCREVLARYGLGKETEELVSV